MRGKREEAKARLFEDKGERTKINKRVLGGGR